ncbi:MAG: diguanylate cyclase (GGDEF)-like protein/PAS domain S-box-containing protein, partial [Gammaproteobacteria bacterium]
MNKLNETVVRERPTLISNKPITPEDVRGSRNVSTSKIPHERMARAGHNGSMRIGNGTMSQCYVRHASSWWAATNIIAALACAVVGWDHATSATLMTWLIFCILNAFLYMGISHGLVPAIHGRGSAGFITNWAVALTFGAIWGIVIFALGPQLPIGPALLLSGIILAVTAAALIVFSVHVGAYPIFLVPVALLATLGLGQNPNLDSAASVIVGSSALLLGLSAVFAKLARTTVNAIDNIISITGVDKKLAPSELGIFLNLQTRRLKQLVRDNRHAKSTLDAIGEAIITTTEGGLIDYMNPVAEVLTGVQFANAHGERIDSIVKLNTGENSTLLTSLIETCRLEGNVRSTGNRVNLLRNDGLEYDIEYQISVIRDDRNGVAGMTCLLRDVTTRQHLIRNAQWRETHDPLTNLINRTEFEHRINNLLASENSDQKQHAMCFIDFDDFKLVNETHGINAGNQVLKSIAIELKQKIRGADTLARIGEDKFGVILYSCPMDKASLIAEGLRRIVEDFQMQWNDIHLSFSVSVGVIPVIPTRDNLTNVLGLAETACERAKKDGGNRVHSFSDKQESQVNGHENISRIREIQAAIQSDSFELHFQHIHPIRGEGHRPSTCKLLLRIKDSSGEIYSPREILLAADRYHLMPTIDRWATKAGIDALTMKHPALVGMDMICINISGRSLNDDRFLEYIVNLLEEDVDSSRICFDISESSLISSVERAQFFIATLKELGCKIALDDFGFGMSSFELLKRL